MKMTKGTSIIAVMLLCIGFNAVSAENSKQATGKAFSNATTYTWYNGSRAKTIWLNPDLIAEFNGNVKQQANNALANSATPVPGKRASIRLWRLKQGKTSKQQMKQLQNNLPNAKVSPVLHDGPSSSGRKRALPGNIIVHLDPGWNSQQVKTWLQSNKLEVVKRLNIGPNIYVIKTGPGLEALEKANAIYQSGEVVAAYPDWWQEVVKR